MTTITSEKCRHCGADIRSCTRPKACGGMHWISGEPPQETQYCLLPDGHRRRHRPDTDTYGDVGEQA